MELKETMTGMLELILRPAFCVKDGVITAINPAAEAAMITVGTPIFQLLMTGSTEYQEFKGGCLYLTLRLHDIPCGASVTRLDEYDIFTLDQEDDQAELQAMALAAQELRKPLSNIMAIADSLFPILSDSDGSSCQEQVARLNKGLFQLHRIVNNMSDAHRYNQFAETHQEERDVCAILAELFSSSAAMVLHAGITLDFDNWNESVYSLVDAEKLERAVNNIISNALKYTPKGGTIHAKLTRRADMLYLTVQDSGNGMESSIRRTAFSRFMRQPGLEDGQFGIGLGMVLIRSAAAKHGGTVLLECPPDSGMRLTMTLEIRHNPSSIVRSNILRVDYAGERDHQLLELSDSLPAHLYRSK